MAPAKRRAGKAAACQKWKLGDLVLAKVKGFPAWPAKISEPESWGQTHDPKKVFVHFFGTQEIGFCAPLDVQLFTLELKNKLLARCQGKVASDFTRAVGEICEEYNNLEGENRDFASEIQRSKARECDESSNDSVEKIHYNKDTKMLTSVHDTEEMLEVQNDFRVQKHCQTTRENDLNQGIHRQVDSQKKQVGVVAAENKDKSSSLIKSAKKEENMVKEVPFGIKRYNFTPRTNNSKSSLKEEKIDNLSKGRSKNNQFGAASAMDESEIKQKKIGLKRSLDTETHNYRVDTGIDCHVKQQNQIYSPDISLVPDQPTSEHKFGQQVLSIAKEVTETYLSHDGNLLELRKSATNNTETELQNFRHGNTEGIIQVSALKEKMKEKQDVVSIQEIVTSSDKNLILSPFIDKKNEEREVVGKFSQQSSFLKKKRNPLKKHNPGASILMKTCVETMQTKDNVSVDDENVFEVLSAAEHRKKRTQLKGRKHKLNTDENLHLAKKARLHSEDESSKLSDCLDIGGVTSAVHNTGRNCPVNNELSHDGHFKAAIYCSVPQIEESLPQDLECSILTDRGTCLPPKADKYRLRSSLPGDEAALPPSKRRHRAQEAMSACVAAAATASVNTVTAASCGKNDAWGNSSDNKPFKGCFENDGILVHANENCIKISDISSPVEETAKVFIKTTMASSVSLQSHGSLPSEPSNCVEDKQVDLRCHGQRDKPQNMDNVNVNTHPKVLDELSFSFPKMDEAKQNGLFESMLPSPKKKDGSEPIARKGNSPQPSPMRVHAGKVDYDHHEFMSKGIKVKKSSTTPAKKSGGSSRKDLVQSSSEKLSQGLLHKHSAVRKNEHPSPIKSGVEPLVEKVGAPSKVSLKINGAVAVKTEIISYCTDLHLEKGNKIREAHETAKEVNFKSKSKEMEMAMSSTSLKHLIAAAQAKREQTRTANMPNHVANEEIVNSIPTFMSSPSPIRENSSHRSSPTQFHSGSLAPEENNNVFTRAESRSPRGNVQQWGPAHVVDMRLSEEQKISSDRKPFGGMLSGDTEAAVARDTFEGMLETLSRTKESIGRASRHAIDCAKYGIAGEVVELLVQRLEIESSSHRKIDLFFLVDSITQCSHSQKGIAGVSYIPAVQAALPRLLSAAAPSGSVARENRRQCLKVLRLWLERKILPESILRQYMNDFGYSNDDRPGGNLVRRPRVERAVDDPMREIEGKLDEYGSNATFHLPGFSMANVFEDEEEPFASDRKNNNESLAVETSEPQGDQTKCLNDPIEKHCHILEDVDGELEMEDVSPTSEYDAAFCKDNTMQPQAQQFPHYLYRPDQSNPCRPLPLGSPPLPEDPPPSPPPLPASPPPPPPSSPPPPPPDSPPFVCQPPMPHSYPVPMNEPQPHLMNGNSQQPGHVVSNATVVDSIAYGSSGFPVSQIHHGQNATSYGAAHAQQLQLNNSNLSFAQQSYLPPPPTIPLSSQFSYVRAEIQTNVRECEKQSTQEDQWRVLHNDRCTGSENQLPINQTGGGKSTLCTSMQEVTPRICWPTGGPQYSSGSHLPTQKLMIRAPGGPMPNMDVGYTAYLDQAAGLTGGVVAAPTNQVMLQMLSSRSGYSSVNAWRPT